jgi:hypothetical protein
MPCYRIPYRDRFGAHEATKWGDTPADARRLLAAAIVSRGIAGAELGVPVAVVPEPFTPPVSLSPSLPLSVSLSSVP